MESCPPPLYMNFRPQEFAPNRGYSSYFPPDQQAKDQERFKQLETMLGVSTNCPKELATDNKLLKGKAKERLTTKIKELQEMIEESSEATLSDTGKPLKKKIQVYERHQKKSCRIISKPVSTAEIRKKGRWRQNKNQIKKGRRGQD